jgi:GDA1/CD39 (nucleoside phosphatase) family
MGRCLLVNVLISTLLLLHGSLFLATSEDKFTIVLDAGSTGSRVYVYKYSPDCPLETITEVSHMRVNPALSTFVGNSTGLAKQLGSLIDFAKRYIQPQESWATTSISLKATAGLRALPVEDQQYLVTHVAHTLSASGFSFDPTMTGVISGAEEALFDVLAVNAAFYAHPQTSASIVPGGASDSQGSNSSVNSGASSSSMSQFVRLGAGDMGGSSQQIAFSVSLSEDANADSVQDPSHSSHGDAKINQVMTVEIDASGEPLFVGPDSVPSMRASPSCQPDWYVSVPARFSRGLSSSSSQCPTSITSTSTEGQEQGQGQGQDRETIAIYAKSLDFMGLIAAMDVVLDSFYNDPSVNPDLTSIDDSDSDSAMTNRNRKDDRAHVPSNSALADPVEFSEGPSGGDPRLQHPCLPIGAFPNIPDFSGPQPLHGAGNFERCRELIKNVLVPYAQRGVNLQCIRQHRPEVRDQLYAISWESCEKKHF